MKNNKEASAKNKSQGLMSKTKLLVFGVVHEMLKHCSYTHIKFVIVTALCFIQIMYFPLNSAVMLDPMHSTTSCGETG